MLPCSASFYASASSNNKVCHPQERLLRRKISTYSQAGSHAESSAHTAKRSCLVLPLDVQWMYGETFMPRTSRLTSSEKRRSRGSRLGFRVDARTKQLVERAAALERRSLTDYCLTALTQATQATITRHESIVLSERDRQVFFDALVHPPKENPRLRRAFRSAKRIVS
jgi:uncharacterized protein (DUF1778 family)